MERFGLSNKHNYNKSIGGNKQSILRVGRLKIVQWILVLFVIGSFQNLQAQHETFPSGAFIVNMGVVPQTVGNGLKPYGLIHDLIFNYGVPISWVIDTLKVKDGIDFSYAGVDYRGGSFIIPAIYRSSAVNTRITYWQGQGVVGVTTTSPLTVPVYKKIKISSAPIWTLDKQNGKIVLPYFANAGIPESAFGGPNSSGWKDPVELNNCDDIFVLPHADPTWAVHNNLMTWNQNHRGSIWAACHSGSALELMFNPANKETQTNFLSKKTGIAQGSGPYASPNNTLIIWGSHSDGTPPYTYAHHGEPVMQFIGPLDAATLNGSEQIFIPVQLDNAGWRPETKIGVWDPDHPQVTRGGSEYRGVILAYGHAYGDPTRGYIMYEAAHTHAKATLPANIAAQRAFFNFSFFAAKFKEPDPEITVDLSIVFSGTENPLIFELQGERDISEFGSILWESSCGGSFQPNNTQSTIFTAPTVNAPTNCVITITLVDGCNKQYKASTAFTIQCGLALSSTAINPCHSTPNQGGIQVSVSNASGPFVYSWNRTEGGSGNGTGGSSPFTISGLSPGTYTLTVTANNGSGCSNTSAITLTLSPEINITATPIHLLCNGGTNGAINISVNGGIPGYTYNWNDGPTTQNRNNIPAGTYTLTVTDSRACTRTTQVVLTQPTAISFTPTINHITCFGQSNGSITLSGSGGTSPYTFLWNDGSPLQNRSNLSAGTYAVTITDANNCTQILNGLTINQPASGLSLSHTQVNVLCNGGATGSIDLTVSGGTPNYTYSWTGPGGYTANTEDINNRPAGLYAVTVTDANGCTSNRQVTITQPAAIVINAMSTNPTCPPNAEEPVNSDGAININVSGGIPAYSYAWSSSNGGVIPSGQENNQNLSGLINGTYTLTVTDSNNCTKTNIVTLVNINPNPVQPAGINH
jgi:hypothetical protein